MTDAELLQRYGEDRDEAAFTELVRRYIDFVYSAAIRQVGGDAHLAQDVTQSVFIDLARKARSLATRAVLTGWLYTSTRYAAAKAVRAEQRRHAREARTMMHQLPDESTCEPAWDQLQPVLDDVMHELNECDRDAVLLRYFEGRQLAEVGAKLGLSEDAARMRVGRALDKLRQLLAKRGVTSTSAALVTLLANQTVGAAPAGLAASVAGTAVATAASATGTTLTILNIMATTKLKIALVSATVIALATPLAIQRQTQAKLREENYSLRQRNDQLASLATENARLSNLLAQADTRPSVGDDTSNELLKLRGEVARLREESRELARLKAARDSERYDPSIEATLQTLAARATRLKRHLEQVPDKKIPELQLITDKEWIDAVAKTQLETDDDYRQALHNLRSSAKGKFGSMMQKAVKKYAAAHDLMLPTDISELLPYFDQPVDPAMLQRYQLVQSGKVADTGGREVIAEIAPPVDDEYDTAYKFHLSGMSSQNSNKTGNALEAAVRAYASANNGLLPRDLSHLTPYLKEPVDSNRAQKYFDNWIPSNLTTLEQLKALRR